MNAHDVIVLPERFAISRAAPDADLPKIDGGRRFFTVSRTADELSVVAEEDLVLDGFERRSGWRCLKLAGPLEFSEIGVLARLTTCLAAANVSVFVVSTYMTDYVLVAEEHLTRSVAALQAAGHRVRPA